MNNKKSKYSFLKADIIDNYFIADIELTKIFIDKYDLNVKRKSLENYVFRIKKQASIISILNSKIKKLAFDKKTPITIELSSRYYFLFEEEFELQYGEDKVKELIYEDFSVSVLRAKNNLKRTSIKFNFEENCVVVKNNNSSEVSKPQKTIDSIRKRKKQTREKENILIIGDLHIPFEHKNYLDFCAKMQKKYRTTKIIFIGDIIDNHYQSFHPTNPDGYSAGEELKRTKDSIATWYKIFPKATIIRGNHDNLFARRAFAQGLSKEWIKNINDVLNVPNWQFRSTYTFQNILFLHGTGISGVTAAYGKSLYTNKSVVMGHQHTQASIIYVDQIRFGMLVGAGININSYAFNYAKHGKKPVILSCGIITKDDVPILETMKI